MWATWLLGGLTGLTAAGTDTAAPEPPGRRELFAREGWYRGQAGKEQVFAGVLQRAERGKGVAGFGRFNPYRLVMAGKKVREVYVGGRSELLEPYVGKRVRITGKAVDMEVEGRMHHEIWPARLEIAAAEEESEECCGEEETAKELKVFARAAWEFERADPDGPKEGKTLVLRSAAELVAATPFRERDAAQEVVEKQATAHLTRALKVGGIDWAKQMLVVVTAGLKPTGGYRVEISAVRAADKTATVRWAVQPPRGAAADVLTHPGQVALVERFDGKVAFVQAGPDKAKEKKEGAGGKQVKVHARSPARLLPGLKGHVVLGGLKDLAKATGKPPEQAAALLAASLKVGEIDWDRQMVLIISGGVQRTGGYAVELQDIDVKDGALTVRWKLKTPAPGDIVTQALTHPALTLLVDRFDGPVRFEPPAPPGAEGLKGRP